MRSIGLYILQYSFNPANPEDIVFVGLGLKGVKKLVLQLLRDKIQTQVCLFYNLLYWVEFNPLACCTVLWKT